MYDTQSYETRYADNLGDSLRDLLQLRETGFWSFRGQRDHCWSVGLHHPPDVDEQRLRDCFSHFRRRCMEFPEPDFIAEESHWRWLFHAQHYRLRTWLLDWTSSPLVALYFAVENILTSQAVLDRRPFGAVWCLSVHPGDFRSEDQLPPHPTEVDRWIMVNPPPLTSRIRRQSAKFSFHPHQDRQPLDKIARRKKERLVKLIIGRKEVVEKSLRGSDDNPAERIRKQLGIMNCHHGSLFPDPEGVALFVNSQLPDIHHEPISPDAL